MLAGGARAIGRVRASSLSARGGCSPLAGRSRRGARRGSADRVVLPGAVRVKKAAVAAAADGRSQRRRRAPEPAGRAAPPRQGWRQAQASAARAPRHARMGSRRTPSRREARGCRTAAPRRAPARALPSPASALPDRDRRGRRRPSLRARPHRRLEANTSRYARQLPTSTPLEAPPPRPPVDEFYFHIHDVQALCPERAGSAGDAARRSSVPSRSAAFVSITSRCRDADGTPLRAAPGTRTQPGAARVH